MKYKAPPTESILLLFSFVVTGIAVLFIFKPQAQQHPKLIKWSKSPSIQKILSNTARRMYPILAESRELVIVAPMGDSVESYQVQQEFQKTTNIPISIDESDKNRLILFSEKEQIIILNLKFHEMSPKQEVPTSFFDYSNLIKIVKELDSPILKDTYIFALYQTGEKTYNLDILNFVKSS